MDEAETVKAGADKLAHLEQEIKEARQHLDEETHAKEKDGPLFYEDDQEEPDQPA